MFDSRNYRIHHQMLFESSADLNQNGWYLTNRSRLQPQWIQVESLVREPHYRWTRVVARFHLHVQQRVLFKCARFPVEGQSRHLQQFNRLCNCSVIVRL